MHTLEFVVVQQMIATVFKFVDSVESKVARRLRRLEKKFVPWKELIHSEQPERSACHAAQQGLDCYG